MKYFVALFLLTQCADGCKCKQPKPTPALVYQFNQPHTWATVVNEYKCEHNCEVPTCPTDKVRQCI